LFLSFRELTTPNYQSFKRLFRAGIPTTVEQLAWAFGQMVITSYAAILGVVILATHQVFMRVQAILSMIYMGFSLGSMTLIGQSIGAEQHQHAERTGRVAGRLMLGVVLFMVLVIIAFSKYLVAMFTTDKEVVALGSALFKLFAIIQIPKAVNAVTMGNLRGAGDLRWLMWLAIISVITMEISLGWVFAFLLQLSLLGLWATMGIDELVRLGLNELRFRKGKWKGIRL